MKTRIIFFIISNLMICSLHYSQNITNTLGTSGVFKIKDGSTDYFTLSQSNGTINLISPLAGSQRGSIFKGSNRFLHTYYGSGTNGNNTFLGLNSGNFTMGGSGNQGSYNTGVGFQSLLSLTTGNSNSAFGNESLFSNTSGSGNSAFGTAALSFNSTGSYNSAFGHESLLQNTTGSNNSAFGSQSLFSNTTGSDNSAFGFQSLYLNTSGLGNSAFGYSSLYSNTTGSYNSAFGYEPLYRNITGFYNSAFGNSPLYSNTTGSNNSAFGQFSLFGNSTGRNNSAFGNSSLFLNTNGIGNTAVGNYSLYSATGNYNTALGDSAGRNITSGSNNIAIGYFAELPSGTTSNQVRIGNTSITYAGIQVAWSVTSDYRYKDNILNTKLGLGFITKLHPVSYTRKNDESNKTEYGLIAQEVEEVLKEEGAEYTGMLNITDEGMYELRYNDLISPMIKAIQELKVNSDLKENQLASLREENLKQYKRILELEKMIREMEWIQEKASYLINTVIEMTQNQTGTTTKKQENKIFRNK